MLSDATYELVKKFVQLGLPAFATLYFTLSNLWGWPYAEQVMGTTAAIATFLGVLLGFSTRAYYNSDARYDGIMDITMNGDGAKMYSLELDSDPYELDSKKDVIFKVSPSTETY